MPDKKEIEELLKSLRDQLKAFEDQYKVTVGKIQALEHILTMYKTPEVLSEA